MAILLLDGRAGLGEFTDAPTQRPDVKAMIDKIDFVVDEKAEKAGYHKMTTIIDITLSDGRVIHGESDFGKGSPANPMSYDEVAEKFRENAAHAGLKRDAVEEVITLVHELERQPSIERLMGLVAKIG